ncbi:MAG: hypothetical protein ABIJ43_04810 [Candidatus Beckwithbacteria bacterium]
MDNQNQNEYLTKDLGEASALMASGIKFSGLRNGEGFYWFIFNSSASNKIVNDYWSGDLEVKAKTYFDCMRTLKDRIYSR